MKNEKKIKYYHIWYCFTQNRILLIVRKKWKHMETKKKRKKIYKYNII